MAAKQTSATRARWWRTRLAAAVALVAVPIMTVPAGAAQKTKESAAISPDANLTNGEVVQVSWRGFPQTAPGTAGGSFVANEVGIYECVANPPGGIYSYYHDCYTAGAPNPHSGTGQTTGLGTGNAADPEVNYSGGVTGADGTGTLPFQVQAGTLHTSVGQTVPQEACGEGSKGCVPDFDIQCDASDPCVLKVVDFSPTYVRDYTGLPNLPGTQAAPGTWSQAVDSAPSIPLKFAPTPNCPPPSSGNPNVSMTGAPSSQYAVQAWAAQLCTGSKTLTADYAPLTEDQAKTDFSAGTTPIALASLAPSSGPPGSGVLAAPIDLSGTSIAFNISSPSGVPEGTVRLTPRLVAMLITNSGAWDQSENPLSSKGLPLAPLVDDPEFKALNPQFKAPSLGMYGPLVLAGARDDTSILTQWIADDFDARRFLAGSDPCASVDQYWQGVSYPTDQLLGMAPSPSDPFPVATGTVSYTGPGANPPSGGLSIAGAQFGGAPGPLTGPKSPLVAPGPRTLPGPASVFVYLKNTSSQPITNIAVYAPGAPGALQGVATSLAPGEEEFWFASLSGYLSGPQKLLLKVTGEQGGANVGLNTTLFYQGGDGSSLGTALSVSNAAVKVTGSTYTGTVTLTNETPWPVGGISGFTNAPPPPGGKTTLHGPTTLAKDQAATYTWKGLTLAGPQTVQVLFGGAGPNPEEGNAYKPTVSNQTVAQDLFYNVPTTGSSSPPSVNGIMGELDTATANQSKLSSAAVDAASSTSQLSKYVNITSSGCTPKKVTSFSGFVAPTQASLDAGVASMKPGPDGSLLPPVTTTNTAAYPLTKVDYAFVPSRGLDSSTAGNVATFLRYAAGPGQSPKILPPSYPPLPASLAAQTLAVANEVAKESSGGPGSSGGGSGGGSGGLGGLGNLGNLGNLGSLGSLGGLGGLGGGALGAAGSGSGGSGNGGGSAGGAGSQLAQGHHNGGPGSGQTRLAGARQGPVDTAGGSWLTGAWLLPLIAGLIILLGGAGLVFRYRTRSAARGAGG